VGLRGGGGPDVKGEDQDEGGGVRVVEGKGERRVGDER